MSVKAITTQCGPYGETRDKGWLNVPCFFSPTATCTELNLGYCNDLDYSRWVILGYIINLVWTGVLAD